MAKTPVYSRTNHSTQAVLRVQFRQACKAPPAERVPGLSVEPDCHDKQDPSRDPGQCIALKSPRQKFVAPSDNAHRENQPCRQRHPKSAVAQTPPEADGGMKHKPVERNPKQKNEIKQRN